MMSGSPDHPDVLDRARGAFDAAVAEVRPADTAALADARAHLDRLTKPVGSLGRLEDLAVRLTAIAGELPPPIPERAVVTVFAGDHGVVEAGVTPWPSEVTAQMVLNFLAGGAAVNALAQGAGADVVVVDVGVAGDLPEAPGLIAARIRRGTSNLASGPAMSRDEAGTALDIGAFVARSLVGDGADCLLTGDMGIGNTTPSAALIAAFSGSPADAVTGRGTGIDDEHFARKVAVVAAALDRLGTPDADPMGTLAEVGGFEIAALAGYIVAGASLRVPVVLDGVIALAAACTAAALAPASADFMVAGHRSTEPGATIALEHLALEPVIDLAMRLGEGTGACLALPCLRAAARILSDMATFDSAGVTDKT